jgi:hypothetical protein
MRTGNVPHQSGVEQLALKRPGDDDGRWTIVPVQEVRIVFLGNSVHTKRLTFPGLALDHVLANHVYVRTGGGLYLTQFRSVSDCLAQVAVADLMNCFASIAINLRHLAWLEDRGHQRLGGLRVGLNNGTDTVPISRRHLREILKKLGRPCRGTDHEE